MPLTSRVLLIASEPMKMLPAPQNADRCFGEWAIKGTDRACVNLGLCGAAVTVAGGLSPGWTRRVTGCLSRLAPASEAAITQATTRERTSGSLCLPSKGRSEAAEAPPGSPGDHGPYRAGPGPSKLRGSRGRVPGLEAPRHGKKLQSQLDGTARWGGGAKDQLALWYLATVKFQTSSAARFRIVRTPYITPYQTGPDRSSTKWTAMAGRSQSQARSVNMTRSPDKCVCSCTRDHI